MMYAYFRLVLRRGSGRKKNRPETPPEAANGNFLDCLRAEAISRVNDNLASVLAQRGKPGPARTQRGLEHGIAARLADSRQTLQSLFSGEVVAAYDKAVAALDGRHVSGGDAMRLVTEFKGKVAGYLENRVGLSGEPASG